MALLLSCREVKKDFGEVCILNKISFDIAVGDRIGLVGLNGAGKTTLANIISGNIEIEGGNICWHKKSVNIGYLKQESAYIGTMAIEESSEAFLSASSKIGLKKVQEWGEEKLENLSGGEKTKLSISKVWALNPDLLILDEPTNHLDYQGVQWLINEVKKYRGTVIIISHDRYFLDECVTRIVEIENSTLQEYNGNYSFYREEKKRRYESQLNEYMLQEEKKRKIDEQIDALKTWSAKAHRDAPAKARAAGNKKGGKEFLRVKAKKMDIQIKSRIKKLEKIKVEGVEKPKEERKIDFRISSVQLKGNRIIEAANITKAFNNKILFKGSSFYIQKGEKVGVFGENGCGKTTLLKLLLGIEKTDEGEIFLSSSARVGYLSQDISELELHKKVLDYFDISSREERGKLQTLLFNVGFDESMLDRTIDSLSLGEVTRLRIVQLIVKEYDLLILDEPLNHLDIHSREKLEEVLESYNGTILLVSHDRYMVERICNKLVVFEKNKIKKLEFGLKEFLESKLLVKKNNSKDKREKMMLIENEMSYVLGELCKYPEGSYEYLELDLKFKDLVSKKKVLQADLS